MDDGLNEGILAKSSFLNLGHSKGDWDDDFLGDDSSGGMMAQSTVSPAVFGLTAATVTTNSITTIVVVTLSVLLAIAAIFALVMLIDFRHQKMDDIKQKEATTMRKRTSKLRLPRCRRVQETDSCNITENAEPTGYSRPPLETIAEVV